MIIFLQKGAVFETKNGSKAVVLRKLSVPFDDFAFSGVIISKTSNDEDPSELRRGRVCWWTRDGEAKEETGGKCGLDVVKIIKMGGATSTQGLGDSGVIICWDAISDWVNVFVQGKDGG